MVVVEFVFSGRGGLEQLIDHTATAVEEVFGRHKIEWSRSHPVTLRESLGLAFQQQIIGGSRCHCGLSATTHKKAYRVWLVLPEGGLRLWTSQLVDRISAGAGFGGGKQGLKVRKEIQSILTAQLGQVLERSELPPLLLAAPPRG